MRILRCEDMVNIKKDTVYCVVNKETNTFSLPRIKRANNEVGWFYDEVLPTSFHSISEGMLDMSRMLDKVNYTGLGRINLIDGEDKDIFYILFDEKEINLK